MPMPAPRTPSPLRLSLPLGLLALGLAGALAATLAAPASAAGWETLGERLVQHRSEQDVIYVTAKEGRFTKIKFEVKRARVEFLDVKVHFGDGDVADIALRQTIRAGGESRAIDLPGGRRIIEKVVFRYRTAGRRGPQALVVLLGKD